MNTNPLTERDQDRCHGCGKFLPFDDSQHYYHCSERCSSGDDWDMHPVAAFCTPLCAEHFHQGTPR